MLQFLLIDLGFGEIMSLKNQLQEDMKAAMKSGDTVKRDAVRSLLAAIKYTEKDGQIELDDQGVILVIQKLVKQRQETIEDAQRAGRPQMIESEKADLAVLDTYLPEMMSEEEITNEAQVVIAEIGATSPQNMGKVMSRLMPQIKGKADGRLVNKIVQDLLSNSAGK
jgi:uncharacterized protein YqeY